MAQEPKNLIAEFIMSTELLAYQNQYKVCCYCGNSKNNPHSAHCIFYRAREALGHNPKEYIEQNNGRTTAKIN